MSDQSAPAPGAEEPPGGTTPPGTGADPYKLHDHAIQASKHLEALATGLGHADAPEKVTATFTKMADACRSLASTMSRAPAPAPKPAQRETMDSGVESLAQSARRS